ncbi:MAG: hypothetical protein KJ732_08270, partial [Candidatus Margulisbacteria bacterium]|nr:hypothetical protein [Candidatus Margulisiibacteriota bacterium]
MFTKHKFQVWLYSILILSVISVGGCSDILETTILEITPTPNIFITVATEHIIGTAAADAVSTLASATTSLPSPTVTTDIQSQEPSLSPTSIPMPLMGVEIHNMRSESLRELLSNTKAQIVRRNAVEWDRVEPQEGNRNWSVLSDLEQDLEYISDMGLQTILIVRGTPDWAQKVPGSTCGPIEEEDLDAFANFMAELVERYSVPPYNVKYWELGNEPDVDA